MMDLRDSWNGLSLATAFVHSLCNSSGVPQNIGLFSLNREDVVRRIARQPLPITLTASVAWLFMTVMHDSR